MALYDYKCDICGNSEEKNHKIHEQPQYVCSQCGSKMTKIITSTNFHLKGGGWYKSGFSGKNK